MPSYQRFTGGTTMSSKSPRPPLPPMQPLSPRVSDVTMSDALEEDASRRSMPMEYSDTEEDLSPYPLSQPAYLWGSAPGSFRHKTDSFSKNMRVVKFDNDALSVGKEEGDEEQLPQRQQLDYHKSSRRRFQTWMEKLAYSFRSPDDSNLQRKRLSNPVLDEFPNTGGTPPKDTPAAVEASPLLPSYRKSETSDTIHPYVAIAAALLQDYEANRPPTFPSNIDSVTAWQVLLFQWKYSGFIFPTALYVASLSFFLSSLLEGFDIPPMHLIYLTLLNTFAVVVFTIDLWIRHELQTPSSTSRVPPVLNRTVSSSRTERLDKAVVFFCAIIMAENFARLVTVRSNSMVLFSSIFKPLVLFYVSSQARDALEALRRVIRNVAQIILMELLLILMFAAVACRLFNQYDGFRNLHVAWLSLFELSTTVVNPSIWIHIYQSSRISALFFILFIAVSVFYMHSLVLSVVFQNFIQAAAELHQRSAKDREDAVHLAYMALQRVGAREDAVDIRCVRETLRLMRPHYSTIKINALVEIVGPSNQSTVDFQTFRIKIRQALNASVRTARTVSTLSISIELVAVFVAVANFIYVILVSSEYSFPGGQAVQEYTGSAITVLAAFELLMRFNPLRLPDFVPLTRLNVTFDGLALVASVVSCVGIMLLLTGKPDPEEFILTGRAIDMIRVMRFFQIFRDIVRRSSDVMPALGGPVCLVITTMHVFVYIGMALWGGSVDPAMQSSSIPPLYSLNNFNSFQEGVVTVFQLLVVCDWQAIAQVFLHASRCSSPVIVYPFFIMGNLVGVSVMLNVLTAFFVQTFVTRLGEDGDGYVETTHSRKAKTTLSTSNSTPSPARRISSLSFEQVIEEENGSDRGADADSEGSSESLAFEFDVYEREGLDKIMLAASGITFDGGEHARLVCNYLEVFESLAPGRETVGYLLFDQQTLERFGNRRFKMKAEGFLEQNELHVVVTDMHAELLALASRVTTNERTLFRRFAQKQDPSSSKFLEISGSLLRMNPALSLFVSRVVPPSTLLTS